VLDFRKGRGPFGLLLLGVRVATKLSAGSVQTLPRPRKVLEDGLVLWQTRKDVELICVSTVGVSVGEQPVCTHEEVIASGSSCNRATSRSLTLSTETLSFDVSPGVRITIHE